MQAKFNLGQTLATPGALAALEESGESPGSLLNRHSQGEWGDLCDEDKALNDAALVNGTRLLSAYTTLSGVRLYVITEATDEDGNRAATTILRTDEY